MTQYINAAKEAARAAAQAAVDGAAKLSTLQQKELAEHREKRDEIIARKNATREAARAVTAQINTELQKDVSAIDTELVELETLWEKRKIEIGLRNEPITVNLNPVIDTPIKAYAAAERVGIGIYKNLKERLTAARQTA